MSCVWPKCQGNNFCSPVNMRKISINVFWVPGLTIAFSWVVQSIWNIMQKCQGESQLHAHSLKGLADYTQNISGTGWCIIATLVSDRTLAHVYELWLHVWYYRDYAAVYFEASWLYWEVSKHMVSVVM